MFTIHKEQMEVLVDAQQKIFEDEMVKHLKDFAPYHTKTMDDTKINKVVQMGIHKARSYGVSNRGPVRFFLEMMFMFGSHFDQDPQYPWANLILTSKTLHPNTEKINSLYKSCMEFLDKVAGPNNTHAIAAFQRVNEVTPETFLQKETAIEVVILASMHHVYPEKYNYVGETQLKHMIELAKEQFSKYFDPNERHFLIFTGFMYAMGFHFIDDPLHSWVIETLTQTQTKQHPMAHLYERGRKYLSAVLRNLS